MPKKILILGGTGRLGRTLVQTFAQMDTEVYAPAHAEVHAEREDEIVKYATRALGGAPEAIVCAAAWTDVASAKQHQSAAYVGNVLAPQGAARAATYWGVPLVHYSTDYVFSGGGRRVLHSNERTLPQGVYGRTKLAGERAARDVIHGSVARLLVVRAGWLYSECRSEGFPSRVLALALQGRLRAMRVNQYGRPTSYEALARWSAEMLVGNAMAAIQPGATKVLHFAPEGNFVSRYALTRYVLERAAESGLLPAGTERNNLENILQKLKGLRTHVRSQPENCRLASEQHAFFAGSTDSPWEVAVTRAVVRFLQERLSARK